MEVPRPGVDLVANLAITHVGADAGHDAGHVVTEHEWRLVSQQQLELAVADHPVQRVDSGRTNPNEDVARTDRGFRYMGGAEATLAVLRNDECVHLIGAA